MLDSCTDEHNIESWRSKIFIPCNCTYEYVAGYHNLFWKNYYLHIEFAYVTFVGHDLKIGNFKIRFLFYDLVR
jgi:hypothetical protein